MFKKIIILSLLLSSTVIASNSFSVISREGINLEIARVEMQLNLSEQQAKAMSPILKNSIKQKIDVLTDYGIAFTRDAKQPELTWREKSDIYNQITLINREVTMQASGVLDEKQMAKFVEIQQQKRRQLFDYFKSLVS
ncbi:hypothetical protein HR060_10035 [Catenovulum sp. SM1970]|uniref:hypothetical protein n=1 Tax=Marinifaba aquimaris TaxID=2741323 RepID=UPI001572B6F4|nr:hypothetical protein [Marinifaba aquimaris]NTS77202.1 hypothetical protein [Marinifaba aquimaris]